MDRKSRFRHLILNTVAVLLLGEIAYAQPWNPQIIWEREGAGDSSRYGGTIFGLGDQNDDGFDDFAVEAWGWGGTGQLHEPKTEFFLGGNPLDTQPIFVNTGALYGGAYYYGAEPLGDINNDGYIDWGTAADTSVNGFYNFRIYYGGAGFEQDPAQVWLLPLTTYYVPIGDFNGDNFDDLGTYDNGFQVLFGSEMIDPIVDWEKHNCSVIDWHGDFNGDQCDDLVEQAFPNDSIRIYFGGLAPDTFVDAGIPGDYFDLSVADLNTDGRDDILAERNNQGSSDVMVWYGNPVFTILPNATLIQPCGLGSTSHAASIGDINDDGYNDLGVASEFCNNNWWGIASVWLGYSWLNPNPVYTFQGRSAPWDLIGIREIEGVGDVNGDGVDDFAIGAFNGDFDGFRGRAIIIEGNPELQVPADEVPLTNVDQLSIFVYPNPANATATLSIELPAFATSITVILFNTLGQQVYQATETGAFTHVRHSLSLTDLSSGLYFAQITAGNLQQTTKLLILK